MANIPTDFQNLGQRIIALGRPYRRHNNIIQTLQKERPKPSKMAGLPDSSFPCSNGNRMYRSIFGRKLVRQRNNPSLGRKFRKPSNQVHRPNSPNSNLRTSLLNIDSSIGNLTQRSQTLRTKRQISSSIDLNNKTSVAMR